MDKLFAVGKESGWIVLHTKLQILLIQSGIKFRLVIHIECHWTCEKCYFWNKKRKTTCLEMYTNKASSLWGEGQGREILFVLRIEKVPKSKW